MRENEFWCRAFLVSLDNGLDFDGCEKVANDALAVARRRGMVTAGQPDWHGEPPELERVEFTAQRRSPGSCMWALFGPGLDGIEVEEGEGRAAHDNGNVVHIKWGESMPPKPIEVWIERPAAKGGA